MLKCLGGVRCTQAKACGPSRAADSARGGGAVSECLELHGVCLWRVRRIAWQKESCRAGLLTWILDFSLEVDAASEAATPLTHQLDPQSNSRRRGRTARSSGRRARATSQERALGSRSSAQECSHLFSCRRLLAYNSSRTTAKDKSV